MTLTPYLVRPDRVEAVAKRAAAWKAVSFDCETTGLDTYSGDRLLGFSLGGLDSDDAFYFPVSHPDGTNIPMSAFAPLVEAVRGKPLIGWNIKFDMHASRDIFDGWRGSTLYDAIVAGRILADEPHPALSLADQTYRKLGMDYTAGCVDTSKLPRIPKLEVKYAGDKEALLGALAKEGLTLQATGQKCSEDIHFTRLLYSHYKVELQENPKLLRLFQYEIRLSRRLFEMEYRGVEYDADEVHRLDVKIEEVRAEIIAELQVRIPKEAPTFEIDEKKGFNPNSSPQVGQLLEIRGFKSSEKTKAKKDSWKRDQLMELNDYTALLIAQYRALGHEKSNLIKELLAYIETGCPALHATYKNWGTVTGRLSSADPNVQGIAAGWLQMGSVGEQGEPLRWSTEGPDYDISMRSVFVPRDGFAFLYIDYRQIEMFVAGFYLGDPAFLDLLQSDDFHAATAERVWGEANSDTRKRAKWFNFGLLYGMGIKAMAKKIGCSEDQAKVWKAEYFRVLGPGYQRAMRFIERKLRQRGWIENMFGRRYWLDEDVAYIGWNYLCQGSAGDYVKFRQLAIEEWVDANGIFPILSTHDDICFEIPLDKIDAAFLEPLFQILEAGDPFGIPLPMKVQIGRKNYAEMEDFERVKKEETVVA